MSKTRTVAYIRVSTTEQAESGVSLSAQKAKLEAYCVAMDLDLVDVVADRGVSAKSLDRPGLSRALAMLDSGDADCLLVTKLDRLTRSVRDLGVLLDRYFAGERYTLMSVSDSIDTGSAMGRLMLNLLVSVSQWERETIGERTSQALSHLRDSGVTLGAPAYGWTRTDERDADNRLVIAQVKAEIDIMREVVRMRDSGMTHAQIAGALNTRGIPTKRGKQWHPTTVTRLLARASA